ncbi:ABC transporter ATP-binding protein [Bradyrhizobium sp. Gha]|uniref:oligopeptide/dipeptide ABC transporter ATP-binding protein n=1 Tax=Bradyrhizobium sp. Gha TaxID=1855318 RepID=UPI0008E0CDF4|nr:ABC transporter ATP-binding protein [Bradyrhizobium sp. Gha]SFK16682.1 oligopeptide transport system ATP-binding protein [Bradyrhizobium sp. Gha]
MTGDPPNRLLLAAEQVTRIYRVGARALPFTSPPHVSAVQNVTLMLHAGERLGIVGESGSGKSTLGRLLMGFDQPTHGRVLYCGRDIREFSRTERFGFHRAVQMVFQDTHGALNPRLRIFDQVIEPLDVHRLGTRQQRRNRVHDLLSKVGLPAAIAERYPAELSGGQRQRVVIARALALAPKILICDEPTSAADVSVQAQIVNLLDDLAQSERLTLVLVSHSLAVVRHLCTRVAVMHSGCIVEEAPAEVLFHEPLHPYTRALLGASPALARRRRRSTPVQSCTAISSPSGIGCAYASACPDVAELCRSAAPNLIELVPAHHVACHKVTTGRRSEKRIEEDHAGIGA